MKISFLVFLVSAILLALFAPTGEAKGPVASRRTNLDSFRRRIGKPLGKRALPRALPGLI